MGGPSNQTQTLHASPAGASFVSNTSWFGLSSFVFTLIGVRTEYTITHSKDTIARSSFIVVTSRAQRGSSRNVQTRSIAFRHGASEGSRNVPRQ